MPIQDSRVSDRAVSYLNEKYSPKGNRTGWLMIGSIFIESWDLYSIAFVLVFIKEIYHPSSLMLGLAAAGTQAGAAVGALLGGWLSDKIGRRFVFLATMIAFIVFGLAQAFAPTVATLAIIRFALGIPLGSDIANGYTYIMESLPRGKREVMGNRWQFMFAVGEIAAAGIVAILYAAGVDHSILWRLVLGLGAVPAVVLFFLRYNLPETAIWLVQKGRYVEAKQVTEAMYHYRLDMLPDADVEVPKVKLSRFLADTWSSDVKRRSTLFGWIAGTMQGLEFSTFAFYLPILFVLVGVSGILVTALLTMVLYVIAAISGLVGPQITPRIGQRGLSIYGFSIVLVSLLVAGIAIDVGALAVVPFAAAAMLWGHYWAAENCMTIPSLVARPKYRGTATGFAYLFVKVPSFLAIFLFPTFFDFIGKGNATLFVAIFPLIGVLAAVFIFREIYGYSEDASEQAVAA